MNNEENRQRQLDGINSVVNLLDEITHSTVSHIRHYFAQYYKDDVRRQNREQKEYQFFIYDFCELQMDNVICIFMLELLKSSGLFAEDEAIRMIEEKRNELYAKDKIEQKHPSLFFVKGKPIKKRRIK